MRSWNQRSYQHKVKELAQRSCCNTRLSKSYFSITKLDLLLPPEPVVLQRVAERAEHPIHYAHTSVIASAVLSDHY